MRGCACAASIDAMANGVSPDVINAFYCPAVRYLPALRRAIYARYATIWSSSRSLN